jgi:hypothetical protein
MLRLNFTLVFLCHACFLPSLQDGLMLDVSLVSLCYNMPLHRTAAMPLRACRLTRVVDL